MVVLLAPCVKSISEPDPVYELALHFELESPPLSETVRVASPSVSVKVGRASSELSKV